MERECNKKTRSRHLRFTNFTPMTQLIFPDSSKLVSSSFDETVQEFDLRTAKSVVVYNTTDDAGISSLEAAGTTQCYHASCDDGTLRLIDRRAQKIQGSSYHLHEQKDQYRAPTSKSRLEEDSQKKSIKTL